MSARTTAAPTRPAGRTATGTAAPTRRRPGGPAATTTASPRTPHVTTRPNVRHSAAPTPKQSWWATATAKFSMTAVIVYLSYGALVWDLLGQMFFNDTTPVWKFQAGVMMITGAILLGIRHGLGIRPGAMKAAVIALISVLGSSVWYFTYQASYSQWQFKGSLGLAALGLVLYVVRTKLPKN